LGTAMTEKQIELIWKFFKNPIICLDGDVSGKKAAVRAAEKLFPIMKPDSNIYFLTLPENLDPDSYINQKGKDSFTKLVQNKIDIKEFIWNSYYGEIDKKDPQSLALFEKKIKSLCWEVKDKTLAKYFLDSFMEKINELTPHYNYKRNNFLKIKKISNPLRQTKEIYRQMNKFEEKELKEFSILFLVMKNLDLFRKNIELISEINFSTDTMNLFKQKLIDCLLSEKFFDKKEIKIDDFDEKFKNIINQINDNAPIKIIHKNKSDADIIIMFNEILKEIEKIELRKKIESLEDKVSLNLDENLYTELLTLRNQLKGG
jgi:DNA primase